MSQWWRPSRAGEPVGEVAYTPDGYFLRTYAEFPDRVLWEVRELGAGPIIMFSGGASSRAEAHERIEEVLGRERAIRASRPTITS